MKLVTIAQGSSGTSGAMLRSGEILNFSRAAAAGTLEAWIPADLSAILAAGPQGLALVRAAVANVEEGDDELRRRLRHALALTAPDTPLLSPLPAPRLLLAAGLAYKSHLAEMAGTPTPKQPTAFMKSPHSVTGPGAAVALPSEAGEHVDYEGELAVVFGSECHRVTPDQAMACVAGYMAANDISARDWIPAVVGATQPWEARHSWEVNIMGKQFDGFTPLGPVLLTADEVPDPGRLEITTRLNGKPMQHAPVSDLIFELGQTISHFSRWYTFRPGDVLLTGTPAGVGVGRKPPVFMRAGDVVEVEITGIGTLRNTIVARSA
ncbi:MAG TPA: fumarylacetoacetate hydrolase family protein [Albitalea sp.]|uniref:fumarylacetoacetate hydrolase family protein n=1 Tax=Piscinibacter sp. TaxID=1903157 RepID=UPI002ED6A9DC